MSDTSSEGKRGKGDNGYADGASSNVTDEDYITGEKDGSIVVTGIPLTQEIFVTLIDKLTIHFQRRCNGGGDVNKVEICCESPSTLSAKVTFCNPDVVKTVVKMKHTIFNENVKVEKYVPKKEEVDQLFLKSTGGATAIGKRTGTEHELLEQQKETEDVKAQVKTLQDENKTLKRETKMATNKLEEEIKAYSETVDKLKEQQQETEDAKAQVKILQDENQTLNRKLSTLKYKHLEAEKIAGKLHGEKIAINEMLNKDVFDSFTSTLPLDELKLDKTDLEKVLKDAGTTYELKDTVVLIKGHLFQLMKVIDNLVEVVDKGEDMTTNKYMLLDVVGILQLDELQLTLDKVKPILDDHAQQYKVVESNKIRVKGNLQQIINMNEMLVSLQSGQADAKHSTAAISSDIEFLGDSSGPVDKVRDGVGKDKEEKPVSQDEDFDDERQNKFGNKNVKSRGYKSRSTESKPATKNTDVSSQTKIRNKDSMYDKGNNKQENDKHTASGAASVKERAFSPKVTGIGQNKEAPIPKPRKTTKHESHPEKLKAFDNTHEKDADTQPPESNIIAQHERDGATKQQSEPTSSTENIFIEENHCILNHLFIIHSVEISKLSKDCKVKPEWGAEPDQRKVYLTPEPGHPEEVAREAHEKFQNFIKDKKSHLKYITFTIDESKWLRYGKEKLVKAQDIIAQYAGAKKLTYYKTEKGMYSLLGEDDHILRKAAVEFWHEIGTDPPQLKMKPVIAEPDKSTLKHDGDDLAVVPDAEKEELALEDPGENGKLDIIEKLSINEDYHTLLFVHRMYKVEIDEIRNRYNIGIELVADDEGAVLCIGSSAEAVRKAKEKFELLVEVVKPLVKVRSVDFSNVSKFCREDKNNVEKLLVIYEENIVYTVSSRKYTLVSQDEILLDRAVQVVYSTVVIRPQRSPEASGRSMTYHLSGAAVSQVDLSSSSAVAPPAIHVSSTTTVPQLASVGRGQIDPDSKSFHETTKDVTRQATVGEDMLAYIFHVHSERLARDENKHKIKFERKGCSDILISPAMGLGSCEQQDLDTVYESFVTFVQGLHSKLQSKDVDFSSKAILSHDISQARSEVHKQYNKIFIKEVEPKQFRVMGESDDVRAAVEVFCKCLGVTLQTSRHGGKKQSQSQGLQRSKSVSDDQHSENAARFLEFEIQGKKVVVCRGDITKERVDAISNAANDKLDHGGGIAGAIVRAGGYSIQRESNDILKAMKRSLKLSEVVYTKAGSLPCVWVLHVVGPRWSDWNERQVKKALYDCFYNLMVVAKGLALKSIAIPAIGTGLYGVPKQVCAEVMKEAIFGYLFDDKHRKETMKEIHFVDVDSVTVETYIRVFEAYLKELGVPYKKGDMTGNRSRFHWKESSVDGALNVSGVASHSGSQDPSMMSGNAGKGHIQDKVKLFSTVASEGIDRTGISRSSHGRDPGATPKQPGKITSHSLNQDNDSKDNECAICMDKKKNPKTLPCKHSFCKECIDQAEKLSGASCPICKVPFGIIKGNMPEGKMKSYVNQYSSLPGYPGCGNIQITYDFPSGKQGKEHSNPGQKYTGTTRIAYLPNNAEGQEVLRLLKIAFNRRLTFTIGTSSTTGLSDMITWNDIHHKTSEFGGPTKFGYPDPDYLRRVKEELAAKGVK